MRIGGGLIGVMALLAIGCSKEYSAEQLVVHYEKECISSELLGQYQFSAMYVSADYYRAKWGGKTPDAAIRILFSLQPISAADPVDRMKVDPLLSRFQDGPDAYARQLSDFQERLGDRVVLLTEAGDTLPAIAYHFTNNYGMSPVRSFLFLFPSEHDGTRTNVKGSILKVEDFGNWGGNVHLPVNVCSEIRLREAS